MPTPQEFYFQVICKLNVQQLSTFGIDDDDCSMPNAQFPIPNRHLQKLNMRYPEPL
ncbi:MAG: hypothetical protein V7K50_20005 [Nostoc sp.]|uniref:hypothetical protein n=1 Tax=Nostoc sp. TaxID=1180 RepID=UPI002FF4CB94